MALAEARGQWRACVWTRSAFEPEHRRPRGRTAFAEFSRLEGLVLDVGCGPPGAAELRRGHGPNVSSESTRSAAHSRVLSPSHRRSLSTCRSGTGSSTVSCLPPRSTTCFSRAGAGRGAARQQVRRHGLRLDRRAAPPPPPKGLRERLRKTARIIEIWTPRGRCASASPEERPTFPPSPIRASSSWRTG